MDSQKDAIEHPIALGCSSASFVGVVSGDSECFCWDQVPATDCELLNPKPDWIKNDPELLELETPGRLYPGDVCRFLGCEQGRRYKFTVIAEAVDYE